MVEIGITAILLVLGYFIGGAKEKKHFENLIRREKALLSKMMVRADKGMKLTTGETFMVASSVVIATDFFKNFVGSMKSLFGGRLTSHETLLDRARREALCRLREKALAKGASEILNIRYDTNFLDQLGIEVSAYGTAVKK